MSKIFEAIKLYVEAANDVLEAQQTLTAVKDEAEQEHGNEFNDTIEELAAMLLQGIGKKVQIVNETAAPVATVNQAAPAPVEPVTVTQEVKSEPVTTVTETPVTEPMATVTQQEVTVIPEIKQEEPVPTVTVTNEPSFESFEEDEDPFAEDSALGEVMNQVVKATPAPAKSKGKEKGKTMIPSFDSFDSFDGDEAPF